MDFMKKIGMVVFVVFFGLQVFSQAFGSEEEFPVKPITIIVPYTAGGGGDKMSRLISETAKKYSPNPSSC